MNEDLLGKCRACGREVSRRAYECPNCREPRPTMTEQEYKEQKTPIEIHEEGRRKSREFDIKVDKAVSIGCLVIILLISIFLFLYC